MKKIMTLAVVLMAFSAAANAQNYFNLGYGRASNNYLWGYIGDEAQTGSTPSNALFAGYSNNIRFAKHFGIEAGINYVYDFKWEPAFEDSKETGVKSTYHGLKLPVMFNYSLDLSKNFSIKVLAGPSLHYGLVNKFDVMADGKKTWGADYYEGDEANSRFNLSASAALAFDWNDILRFKLGYDYGLTDMDNGKTEYTQNLASISIGFIF